MANWAELIPDIITQIAEQLPAVCDQANFSNVCGSWKSVALGLENFYNGSIPTHPEVAVAEVAEEEERRDDMRRILVLTPEGVKSYHVRLPEIENKRCLSSHGWLFTVSLTGSYPVELFHIFSGRRINLPSLDTIPDFQTRAANDPSLSIKKMLISSNPTSSADFFVAVLLGGIYVRPNTINRDLIVYCRPPFQSWIVINIRDDKLPFLIWDIEDFNFINGQLYLVDMEKNILSCDMEEEDDSRRLRRISVGPGNMLKKPYLVGAIDDDTLLVVLCYCNPLEHLPRDVKANVGQGIEAYHVSLKEENKWVEVDISGLGDRAAFLGLNTSIALVADGLTLKPGCIYFTDNSEYPRIKKKCAVMGIYHPWRMGMGMIEPTFTASLRSSRIPPVWVVPSP